MAWGRRGFAAAFVLLALRFGLAT